jgi:hypothetical protein
MNLPGHIFLTAWVSPRASQELVKPERGITVAPLEGVDHSEGVMEGLKGLIELFGSARRQAHQAA